MTLLSPCGCFLGVAVFAGWAGVRSPAGADSKRTHTAILLASVNSSWNPSSLLLRHPNIPQAFDHFLEDGRQFIVMDFIEGTNLLQLMQQRKPKTEEILHWAAIMCDPLAYLHSLTPAIIHRDVEPSNIILTGNDRLFLVDFGFAKVYNTAGAMPSGAKPATPSESHIDETSAPPQDQILARTDPRTDQFSLAATIYCLLTGAPPVDSMDRLLGKADLQPIRGAHRASIDISKCNGCGQCVEACRLKALSLVEEKVVRHDEKCLDCSHCLYLCPEGVYSLPPGAKERFQVSLAHAAAEVLGRFQAKVAFISFVQDVTRSCDCVAPSGFPVVPDIGILASRDVVAIDKASLDLVAQSKPLGEYAGIRSTDILGKINDTDSLIQIRTAHELGLGNMAYELNQQK